MNLRQLYNWFYLQFLVTIDIIAFAVNYTRLKYYKWLDLCGHVKIAGIDCVYYTDGENRYLVPTPRIRGPSKRYVKLEEYFKNDALRMVQFMGPNNDWHGLPDVLIGELELNEDPSLETTENSETVEYGRVINFAPGRGDGRVCSCGMGGDCAHGIFTLPNREMEKSSLQRANNEANALLDKIIQENDKIKAIIDKPILRNKGLIERGREVDYQHDLGVSGFVPPSFPTMTFDATNIKNVSVGEKDIFPPDLLDDESLEKDAATFENIPDEHDPVIRGKTPDSIIEEYSSDTARQMKIEQDQLQRDGISPLDLANTDHVVTGKELPRYRFGVNYDVPERFS